MPVVARPAVTPAPSPPGDVGGQSKRITWTGPNGDTIDLSTRSGGYANLTGREGFGVIDAEIITDRMSSGAALPRGYRMQPRLMTIPLLVEGASEAEYLTRLRRLQASVRHPTDRTTGLPVAGTLTVELPDGSKRWISAYYQGGLSATEDALDDVLAWNAMFPNAQWYAPHPIWWGAPIERVWPVESTPPTFYPIYPVRFGASQVLAEATITNPGDAEAYGIWELTGPGAPNIGNADTGESFAFASAIPAGRTVTVDTRPVELAPATGLTAIDDLGTDWWDQLVDYPTFWSLPPGETHLDISMTGTTSAASKIAFTAASGWQAAW